MTARLAAVILALAVLAAPAGATWSIILVDTATGEVGIASATCLEFWDLRRDLPVVVVGKGAGAAQSMIDMGAVNRKEIWEALKAGTPPAEIIEQLKVGDLFKCSRQYGIADLSPAAAGFTGACAGQYKQHTSGSAGSLTWMVQGNVLTGAPVISAIVDAVQGTPGRLSDRLMAGMQAARAMGGDGRCSCEDGGPTDCGAPPPRFEKSAHVGFLIVARIGDADGVCNGAIGCANGDYWLDVNIIGGPDDADPVDQLQSHYDDFLVRLGGFPDGLLSFGVWDEPTVPGDGQSVRELLVTLVDVHGTPLGTGGWQLDVVHAPGSAGLSARQDVVDQGDGTYLVRVQAGLGEGVDRFALRVSGPSARWATLYPYPALEHVPPGGAPARR